MKYDRANTYAICEKNATVPTFDSSSCYGNSCYYRTPSKMTWDEANTTCLGLGAELASVNSLEKNTYLYILCGSESSCWIGFNDVAVESEWEWSDGSNVEFTNWEKNEPNNQGNHEDYAAIEGETSQWNDYGPAWMNAYAICQKSDTIPAIVWSECYGNSCYYKTSSKMLWTEANTTCEGLGVGLASVDSLEENTFLYYLCGYNNDCWIGLTDEQVEGNWEWTDGSPFDYENWASGEGKSHWSQDYVYFRKNSKGQWYDNDKNFEAYAICEKNATVPFFYSSPCDGNSCYYKTPSKMTWDEANTTCLGLGAELASVHSLEKNTYLYILCGSENSCWIGFNDVAVESEWEWSDGSNVEYTNWEKNEPNNQWNHEDYAAIEGKTSQWNDYGPAWKDAYAICQKSDTIPAIVWSECYGSLCYYKTPSKMSWTEANMTCVGLGVELASVHSLEENTFLYNLCGSGSDCWIGLTDEQAEGDWEWTDGSEFDYSNWRSGEPNNWGDQDYVILDDSTNGQWYDEGDSWQAHAICMTSSAPTETPTHISTASPSIPTYLPSSDPTPTPTSEPTNYPTKLSTNIPTHAFTGFLRAISLCYAEF